MNANLFNRADTLLTNKYSRIAHSMANFDISHAVVGIFHSFDYFKPQK